jgi:hypothetical protein
MGGGRQMALKFTTKEGFCCNPEIKEHKREEELIIWAAH